MSAGGHKNITGSHRLTRKNMDRASGAEVSTITRQEFFGTILTATDVAQVTATALAATITRQEFEESFLSASITATQEAYSNIRAQIGALRAGTANLGAELTQVSDSVINLPAFIRSLSRLSSDISARIGAHPPEDIGASVSSNYPSDIGAYMRPGGSSTSNLGGSLTQIGSHTPLPAFIKSFSTSSKDLGAFLEVKKPSDLRAFVTGYATADLPASIVTERIKNLSAIVWGKVVQATSNFGAYLRQDLHGTLDLGVAPIKAVVSTHTSNKQRNLNKAAKYYNENKFLFGTRAAGLVAFTLEPIFGVFPDLGAEIFAQTLFANRLGALIRGAIRLEKDMPTSALAVSPHIKINKIVLAPNPLKDIQASISTSSGYKAMGAEIKGRFSGSTGTAAGAAYTVTASSQKFILGTTRGLFIPQKNVPTIKTTTFNNPHPLPDLRASLQGWAFSDMGAYIKQYNYTGLGVVIDAVGPNRYRNLGAFARPAHPSNILASIGAKGSFVGLGASASAAGFVSHIQASIVPFINPLAYNTIAVSTKPFRDMGAIINYQTLVSCAPRSQAIPLSAFIRVFTNDASSSADLSSSLNALSLVSGVSAEITGRKRTRLRVLTLNFRAATRGSTSAMASITPLVKDDLDLAASIAGLSHEVNFSASLTPVRYALRNVLVTQSEHAVNLDYPDRTKDIFVSFRSKVSSYVYEDLTNAVYSTDRGTWAIDLRSVKRQEAFFDRDPNSRERLINATLEFHSIDEAIRNAISIICDRVQDNFSASINVSGAVSNIPVSLGIVAADMFKDFRSKVVAVSEVPDIAAVINTGPGSSGYASLPTTLRAGGFERTSTIGAEVDPKVQSSLGAQITAS